MAKAIIIKKNGGPEVLELQDVKVGAPGPDEIKVTNYCLLYTSPSPRDMRRSRMPSSA